MMRFWDSTALTAVIRGEERLWSLCGPEGALVVSWYSSLLCAHLLQAEPGIAIKKRRLLERHLGRLLLTAYQVQPTEKVMERALRVLQIHQLGPDRALELASALAWSLERPQGEELVSLDPELREAAAAEGFTVLPEDVEAFQAAAGERKPA